jgi:hypothetical protein
MELGGSSWRCFGFWARAGSDPPAIETVLPLERAAEAQEFLSSRVHFGRVLLDPRS